MRKEYTNIELTDDIDGSPATTTIEFGVNGKNYVIDLSDDNAAAFNEALAPYIEHARKDCTDPSMGDRQRSHHCQARPAEPGHRCSLRGCARDPGSGRR